MPPAGKKKYTKVGNLSQVTAKKVAAGMGEATSQDPTSKNSVAKGRTRASAKAATNPIRSNKQGIICSHVPKALFDG